MTRFMKAAVLKGVGDVKVEEVPIPRLGPREVLVKVKVTTICPTDVRKYLGHSKFKGRIILGHEFSGVVEEVGREVSNVSVGERVTALPFIFCGHCKYCRLGLHNLCVNLSGLGGAAELGIKLDGSFAQYVKVPSDNVYRLPKKLSFEEASLVEPLAASLNGLMKADLKPGDVVLILGAGPMGLLQTTLAKFLGASRVIVSDLMDERLKYAEKFGADVTVNPLREELSDRVMEETGNYGADITVLSTGGSAMADLLPSSLKLTAKGGRIVVFAGTWPPKKAQIDLNLIHYGERRIIGSFIYTREVFSRALNIAGSSGIDLRELITHKFKLEGVEEAFRIVIRREGLKVALIPNP